MFAAGAIGSLVAGVLLSYVSIWIYTTYLKEVSLPLGDSILFLGAMATILYTVVGAVIAYFTIKHLS